MNKRLSLRAISLCIALAGAMSSPVWAFNSGSTGADGALAPTVNTVIQLPPSGILNYTSITIPQGVTVSFRKNTLNTPVYLLVSGNVTVAGRLAVWGLSSWDVGTFGEGSLANDGLPGIGGPGGFDGGRGGSADPSQRPEVIRGGAGLGPGGGLGGIEVDGCSGGGYYKSMGLGAGHATAGNLSSTQSAWWCPAGSFTDAPRAKSYGSALLQPLLGGSGGGGGLGGTNFAGSGGGGGGGAVLLAATGTITIAPGGMITASAGAAGGASGTGVGGNGGGGSGGAIRLVATTVAGSGALYAQGGCVHTTQSGCLPGQRDATSGGAPGRIRIEAETITFSGTSDPTYTADTPGPLFLASIPALRIDSVAGVAVPDTPTGNADVVLPTDVANPVTVNFKTTNVPTGNTVLLKLIPAYGTPIEVLSPAITGTAESGTASVQVSLPQGPSTLQATTTYTVVVAMGDALSRFAGNERVEKVQLIATLGEQGSPQARLITVSGKEFLVPTEVLAQVSVPG